MKWSWQPGRTISGSQPFFNCIAIYHYLWYQPWIIVKSFCLFFCCIPLYMIMLCFFHCFFACFICFFVLFFSTVKRWDTIFIKKKLTCGYLISVTCREHYLIEILCLRKLVEKVLLAKNCYGLPIGQIR